MSGWCDYLCDFPDDGGATLDRVLDEMAAGSSYNLVHSPLPYFRVRLASPGAAIALAITVCGVVQIEGITDDLEVLVPLAARPLCEQQIADLNHGPARWTRLERIEARGDAWTEFQRSWTSYRRQWRQ